MGLFSDIFHELFGSEPAENDSEKQAKSDYDWERYIHDRDPIPTDPPKWADGIPNPKDF